MRYLIAERILEIGARGTIRIETMPAISVQELVARLGDRDGVTRQGRP